MDFVKKDDERRLEAAELGSVEMRCRDPAGQSELFVRVLRLKTFN